jgi:hypothetical protein
VTAQCSSIRYIITTKNCGACPKSTTNTSITCSISPRTLGKCMLAIQTEVCGTMVGEKSEYIIVNLYGKNLHDTILIVDVCTVIMYDTDTN